MNNHLITLYMEAEGQEDSLFHKIGEGDSPENPEVEAVDLERAKELLLQALEQGEDGMYINLFNGLGTMAGMGRLFELVAFVEEHVGTRNYKICIHPSGITTDGTMEDIEKALVKICALEM